MPVVLRRWARGSARRTVHGFGAPVRFGIRIQKRERRPLDA